MSWVRSLPRSRRKQSDIGRFVADIRTGRFERTMAGLAARRLGDHRRRDLQ